MDKIDVAAIAGLFAIIAAFVLALAYAHESSCERRAALMQVPYSWRLMQGCMIEYAPGSWILLSQYRVVGQQAQARK